MTNSLLNTHKVNMSLERERYDEPKKEVRKECPPAEMIIENIPEVRGELEYLLNGKSDCVVTVRVRNGEVGGFDSSLSRVFREIIKREEFLKGEMRMIIRRDFGSETFSDLWHDDGETIYLWANKNPTEFLLDKSVRHDKEIDAKNIWTPPENALIRVPGDKLHRRPRQALTTAGRYSARVTFYAERG